MELHDVRVDVPTNTPVVLLREANGQGRTLPIWIGSPEASAIAGAMRNTTHQRPFTHDLMKDLLIALGVNVEQVLITELRDSIYYAEIHMKQGERTHIMSSRPSDAIALAARMGVPIFANDALIESEGVILPSDDDPDSDPEELVDEFRHFIEAVRPEDFREAQ
ncbi:MAG: bifunctional nuclease family protein [Actinobacteria bacterium]|nr:bifunctional nuclease family protein [Actinomycetota bacterium]